MPHSIEKKSFVLKTVNANIINTNKSVIVWSDINLRVLLGDLFDKHKKFNLVLKMITTNTVDLTSTSTNRQVKICLSGLNFTNNYDIEYKCNFNKAILVGKYYYNSSDNLIPNSNFEDLQIANNSIQAIRNMTYEQLQTFKWIGSNNSNSSLVNGNSAMGYVRPYPSGNQIVVFQRSGALIPCFICTDIYLTIGYYTISFYVARRPNYTTTNSMFLNIDNTTIFQTIPNSNNWTQYTTNFMINNDKTYNVMFYAVSSINNLNTEFNFGIDSVVLTKNDTISYLETSSVQTFSIDGPQNVDLTIELQDFNNSTTSLGVFPEQIFNFDIYPID